MKRYLSRLEKTQNGGADIKGYIAWSFMDNFERAEGYEPRFGLVYVVYNTNKRIKNDSFFEYKRIIENNGKKILHIKDVQDFSLSINYNLSSVAAFTPHFVFSATCAAKKHLVSEKPLNSAVFQENRGGIGGDRV